MVSKKPSLAVVAAVNDDQCLALNLAASPMLIEGGIPLIVKRGYNQLHWRITVDLTALTPILLFLPIRMFTSREDGRRNFFWLFACWNIEEILGVFWGLSGRTRSATWLAERGPMVYSEK
jgi:hypothetical protein